MTADDLALDHAVFRANQQLDNDLLKPSWDLVRDRARMEAVNDRQDEILAAVAHDLRTPLGVSVGFVDVLRRRSAPKFDDEDRRLLDRIEAQSARMLQLAEDLVDASAVERGIVSPELSAVELRSLLEELVDIHAPTAAKRGITVELDVVDGLPSARVDRNRIAQVVDNLLSNAMKSTPAEQGTTITVS